MKIHFARQVLFLIIFALISVVFFGQKSLAQTQNDAIGIRVIPNPNHYSVYRWYESQGYSGSPQVLTVDGYEALRDGRTVYVNAAHIVPESKQIYTNIYLISYNQDPNEKTVDILGQIISHWQFNDNLETEEAYCSISAIKCSSDVECPSGQTCSLDEGVCEMDELKACEVDADCPTNFFCDSVKAKIIRDLNRVGKMEELREALSNYRDNNGRYPLLSSGTYLPGVSTSLWPSWQESFLSSLQTQNTFLDPINRFGYCPGYDNKTCWDKDAQKFVYSKEGLTLKLPDSSYALVYTTNDAGSEYNLCAVMESRDNSDPRLGYSLNPNDPTGSNCVTATGIVAGGSAGNETPQITDLVLSGIAGQEFNGFVRATDKEDDPLFWRLETGGNFAGWSSAPVIKGTNDQNQKKLFADRAGSAGDYPITIIVTDSKGESTTKTATINIKQSGTLAEANEYVYRLDPGIPFNYSYYISGSTSLPQNNLSLISGPDVLNMPSIEETLVSDGINRLQVNYQGTFSTNIEFKEDTESYYSVSTAGSADIASENRFIIKIKVEKPILDFTCDTQVRVGHDYSCRLGSTKQGNHVVAYNIESDIPSGLELVYIDNEDGSQDVYLQGVANAVHDGQQVIVKAINEYGTENIKNFVLRVNSYCGDGITQTPNKEGKGGIYNNGYEACDGASSVASTVTSSSKSRQYACNTSAGAQTPYPIASYNYCVFKSPLDGGGYCGDTYCQMDLWQTDIDCNKNSDCGPYKVCNMEQGKCYYGERKCTKQEEDSGVLGCCNFDCDPNYTGPPPEDLGGSTGVTECSSTVPCPDGFTCVTGVCQAKCWQVTETAKVLTVREGDATHAGIDYNTRKAPDPGPFTSYQLSGCGETQADVKRCNYQYYLDLSTELAKAEYLRNCSIIELDNPLCQDLNLDDCPIGCNSSYTSISNSPGADDCKKKDTWTAGWDDRSRIICYGNEQILRCYGDPCRTTLQSAVLDGTMNASGQCVKNTSPSVNDSTVNDPIEPFIREDLELLR
jgi:hypothetical protein